jgi:hypothetical protein
MSNKLSFLFIECILGGNRLLLLVTYKVSTEVAAAAAASVQTPFCLDVGNFVWLIIDRTQPYDVANLRLAYPLLWCARCGVLKLNT